MTKHDLTDLYYDKFLLTISITDTIKLHLKSYQFLYNSLKLNNKIHIRDHNAT